MGYLGIVIIIIWVICWFIYKLFTGVSSVVSETVESAKNKKIYEQDLNLFLSRLKSIEREFSNHTEVVTKPEVYKTKNNVENKIITREELSSSLSIEEEHRYAKYLLQKFGIKKLNLIVSEYFNVGYFEASRVVDPITFINNLLKDIESKKIKINLPDCFRSVTFFVPQPILPLKKPHKTIAEKPNKRSIENDYENWSGIFKKIAPKRLTLSEDILNKVQDLECTQWEKEKALTNLYDSQCDMDYITIIEPNFKQKFQEWETKKQLFNELKEEKLRKAQTENKFYLSKDNDAVCDYINLILRLSAYPASFPLEFNMEYTDENKSLVLDYRLPSIEDFPQIKEYRQLKNYGNKPVLFKEAELNKFYDDAIYKIVLSKIYILFTSDEAKALNIITFNGWVKFTNKAKGNLETSYILSLQAIKEEYLAINLEKVDPKECFRNLKGVGSSKLHGLAAIAPIIQLNKQDKRFVAPYEVANSLETSTNLAAMDWQDFENLIRELFEQEFASNGAEVKITRASRDEGVDAVVFDPDPIRGGKIVIQAKRYTNVVGISAVRDLYGTVMNEGAMKGILVTTTDYGPDAYKFAQDKPLTLLNGGNLLHLLAKYGHKAKIDVKEARKTLNLKDRTHY